MPPGIEHINSEDVIPLKLRPLVNKIPYVTELKISVVHLLIELTVVLLANSLNKLGILASGPLCIRK